MTARELDESQSAAVEIDPDSRQIVIAGPGSGKTEVLSALIERMTDEMGVEPIHGMLVISFSNAAVHAAEKRLRAHGASPVAAQTMDSLAAELLRDLATEDYEELDFDGRIAAATRLLGSDGWERIADLEHLLVDEVQDVVGVRADFLIAIIDALPPEAGFTLLGDPAQGIYDFQLEPGRGRSKPQSTTTSSDLLKVLTEAHAPEVKNLTGQYRATSRDAQAAMRLRDSTLREGDTEPDRFFADLVHLGPIEDATDILAGWRGSTALLTATNGQALLTADALRRHGARVEIRRSAQQQVPANWLAAVLGDSPKDRLSKTDFEKLVAERRPDVDATTAWQALRGLVGARGTEVGITGIAARLSTGRPLPPALSQPPSAGIVVSTVHRAKGLEFDNVAVLDFPLRHAPERPVEDARRTQFVALTRARNHLVRADGPDDRALRTIAIRGSQRARWYVGAHKPWMTLGIEIQVGDIEPIREDPNTSQATLLSAVAPGDFLTLDLDVDASTLTLPVYSVAHDGNPVGRTSHSFGDALASRIGNLESRRNTWPTLTGAQVESIGTTASDPRPETSWRHGLHLAPIATGFLMLDWNGATQ